MRKAFWPVRSCARWLAVCGIAAGAGFVSARADDTEAWRTSPYHGAIDGSTGLPIPCICRFRERKFQVGDSVCMTTHVGTVVTRCDFFLNNTTWVPTSEPCTMSWRVSPQKPLLTFLQKPKQAFPRSVAAKS